LFHEELIFYQWILILQEKFRFVAVKLPSILIFLIKYYDNHRFCKLHNIKMLARTTYYGQLCSVTEPLLKGSSSFWYRAGAVTQCRSGSGFELDVHHLFLNCKRFLTGTFPNTCAKFCLFLKGGFAIITVGAGVATA
jgi:hypothetical protein